MINFDVRGRKSLRAARFIRRATSVSGIYAAKSEGRMSQFSRSTSFACTKSNEYRIRKSLGDMVREWLDEMGHALFQQRVVIVGKNPEAGVYAKTPAKLTVKKPKPPSPTPSTMQGLQAVLSKRSVISSQSAHSIYSVMSNKQNAENVSDSESDEEADLPDESPPEIGYKEKLRERILNIRQHVLKNAFFTDDLNGLCMCFGDFTILMVEGGDDLVGDFCAELGKVADELWTVNRVLQVEDNLSELYFTTFHHRFCSPININEKFPNATPNDDYLMGQQHWQLIQKTQTVFKKLAAELSDDTDYAILNCTEFKQFNATIYNKILPEVQRLDLVLNSTRFYRDVQSFAIIYWRIPMEQDDDDIIWPVPYEFTPLGVFDRSPFDVNLTFSDYDKADEKKESEHTEGEDTGTGSENH